MSESTEIAKIVNSDAVQYGLSTANDLHNKLVLGQSRWVCRYGTLSDGHEMITPAQRYFGAIKQMYYISRSIEQLLATELDGEADLIEASDALEFAQSEKDKLRAKAMIIRAKAKVSNAKVMADDQMRMIDEYNKVRLELEEEVTTKYPGGVESAELDSWTAVLKYRVVRNMNERMDNIPLPELEKARLGAKFNRRDALAPLVSQNLDKFPNSLMDMERVLNLIGEKDNGEALLGAVR